MIRSIHYQLYIILFVGFSLTFVFCYGYQIPLIEHVIDIEKFHPFLTLTFITVAILTLSTSILFLPVIFEKDFLYSSEKFREKLATFRWLLPPICFVSLNTTNSFYASLSTLTVFLLTFLLAKKLENVYHGMKTIDNNLAKAIRTTSQYREHIASSFITKAKLEIALKTAEDALENPRLYF
jgi:hypothetical protein